MLIPGAIKEIKFGAKINKNRQIITKNTKDKFKRFERYLKACSLPKTRFLVKMGIIATPIAPVIKTIAIKSGIRKAA